MQGAENDLERALGLLPKSPEPYYFRAKLRLAQNDTHPALTDLNRAISMSAYTDYRFHNARASVLSSIGSWRRALQDYSKSLSAHPLQPEVLIEVAKLLNAQGFRQEALQYVQRALEMTPAKPKEWSCFEQDLHEQPVEQSQTPDGSCPD